MTNSPRRVSNERNTSISVVIHRTRPHPPAPVAPAFSIIVPLGHVTAAACPGGGCPLRFVPSAGAPALLRTRGARVRSGALPVLGRTAGHRADRRSRSAGGPVVRQPLCAAGAEAAAVHRERSAVRPRDRDRAVGPLQCHPEAPGHHRAQRAVSRRDRRSLRRGVLRPGSVRQRGRSRASIASPKRSRSSASRRFRPTRTIPFPPASCCSGPTRIRWARMAGPCSGRSTRAR